MDNTLNLIKQACENFVEKNAVAKNTIKKVFNKAVQDPGEDYANSVLRGITRSQIDGHSVGRDTEVALAGLDVVDNLIRKGRIKQACEEFITEKIAANKAVRVALTKMRSKGLLPSDTSELKALKGNLKQKFTESPTQTLADVNALNSPTGTIVHYPQETFAQRKARRVQNAAREALRRTPEAKAKAARDARIERDLDYADARRRYFIFDKRPAMTPPSEEWYQYLSMEG